MELEGVEEAGEGAERDSVACDRGAGDAAGPETERVGAGETLGVDAWGVGTTAGVGALRAGAGVDIRISGAGALRAGAGVWIWMLGAGVLRVGAGVCIRTLGVAAGDGAGVLRGTEKDGVGVGRCVSDGEGELGETGCR